MKSLAEDLVATCDETVDKPETTSIKDGKTNDKTSCWVIHFALVANECLSLFVAIVVGGQVLREMQINNSTCITKLLWR